MSDIVHVSLYLRAGWYYCKIKRPHGSGRAIRHWLRTKDEKEAWARVKEWKLEEMARADYADAVVREVWTRLIAGRRVTVRGSLDDFQKVREAAGKPMRSIRNESIILDHFVRWVHENALPNFGAAQIGLVEAKHVSGYVNAPGETMLSTRETRLAHITTWLEWCVAQRWLVMNPAADVRVRLDTLTQKQLISVPHQPFTEDQVKTLLATISRTDFWYGAVLLAYEFGLTIGQVATLEETNIVGNMLRVYRTKGKRIVNEPLTEELKAWFTAWKIFRPASDLPYCFPHEAAVYSGGASLSRTFGNLCRKAGIVGRSFHGLRKSATARRWDAELDQLGTPEKRALTKLIAEKGFAAVQKLLAHTPGSEVTAKHYFTQPT